LPVIKKIIFDLEAPFTNRDYKRFGTKILPEAIDWHFGGAWSHILPQF
jgi:hypothetical protein